MCAELEYMPPCVQLPLPNWPKAWEQWLPFWGGQGTWPECALPALSALQQAPVLFLT